MMLCLFGSRFEHPQYALFAVYLDEMTINQLKAELGQREVQQSSHALRLSAAPRANVDPDFLQTA